MLWNNLISWLHPDSQCSVRRTWYSRRESSMYLDMGTCVHVVRRGLSPAPKIHSIQWHDDPTPSIHTSRYTLFCFRAAKLFIIINSLWARLNPNRRVGTQLNMFKNSSFGRKNEIAIKPNDTSRTTEPIAIFAYAPFHWTAVVVRPCLLANAASYTLSSSARHMRYNGGNKNDLKINMFCLHIAAVYLFLSFFLSIETETYTNKVSSDYFCFASIWSYLNP